MDSQADADLYHERFDRVCSVIAGAIAGDETDTRPQPEPPAQPDAVPVLEASGKVSHFGGPGGYRRVAIGRAGIFIQRG